MAIMVEFWQRQNQILVEYNSKTYSLSEFLKLTDSREIIDFMFAKILRDYPDEAKNRSGSKILVVGEFIKKHFLKKDGLYDVIIYDEGKVIKFNLES